VIRRVTRIAPWQAAKFFAVLEFEVVEHEVHPA
jgi:hypothetical protein